MCLSPCSTFAQTAREAGVLPQVESKEAKSSTPPLQTGSHCPGPLQSFVVMEQEPMLHMHAAGWEVERADTAGRLQSGNRARRGEAGSNYTAQSKSPWTRLRQKVSVGRNERTKQAVCAHTSLATTFPAMTNIHKTIPGQYGASDTQVQKIGAGVW